MEEKEEYDELLKKELKRRRIKMFKNLLSIILMGGFALYIYYFERGFEYRTIIIAFSIGYIIIISILMVKRYLKYRSLTDDLLLNGKTIVKYNAYQQIEKARIPIESVEKVYWNIKELPNTFYVVFQKNGERFAVNFYKQRIEEKKKFLEIIKKKDLLYKKTISFDELKEDIEG
ncbi:MAG: hypothetical protein ACOC85_03715 [Thermoplasmatota archaeon]